MNIPDSELIIERTRGQGPGGQHRNKTSSCIKLTHIPTGITVTEDGRNQHANLRKARKTLELRLKQAQDERAATAKKADRDRKVAETVRVRTYNACSGRVKDHRTGMERAFRDVVDRGGIQDFLDEYLWDI